MIRDMIDTRRICSKVKLRQVPVTGSHTQNMICQSSRFRLSHFAAQSLRRLQSKKREKEQYLPKEAVFDRSH